MSSKISIFTLTSFLILFGAVQGATHYVPDDYADIQAAIDASLDGDTIIVKPGTYVENINFKGKAITLESEQGADLTVIDGGQPTIPEAGSVVTFNSNEGLDSVLKGFTITNGWGTWTVWDIHEGYTGGGIYCEGASPLIRGNRVIDNETRPGYKGWAGGIICLSYASPEIMDNTISGNSTTHYGGGIGVWDNGSPLISDNLIENNTADWGGGMFLFYYGTPVVEKNRIIKNTARKSMGGVHTAKYCDAIVFNNFILENEAIGMPTDQGYGGGMGCEKSSPTVTSNIFIGNKGNWSGGAV